MQQPTEIFSDRTLGFTIPSRDVRGRVVRLDDVLETVLSAHDYPPAITHLLAEALVLATLIGSLVKQDQGQMTMQAQTKGGVVNLLVCDFRNGEVRGYVDFDEGRFGALGANPSLSALFGEGYLAITFDMADERGRYQGIVPLEGESLSQACESYFVQSEQVPTLIRVAIKSGDSGCVGAGMLVQHLADGEEGRERLHVRLDHPEWEYVSVMAGSIRHDELLDPALSMEALVWRLFHEEDEIRTQHGAALSRGCRCSAEHYEQVLGRFPPAERDAMRNDEGVIVVDCAFCSKLFSVAV
ncbi:Hsp33 family molecular chaperone HslO [Erythrobacter jejuensis]|uniref:Hsp33 family molecular chaperone HslO n=2 Tax=Parerythrobacter jejuensis TaxID=795812 RepID=A0A845AVD0_9SPHN|nr:Hsp33 family molecular chaperone HslO [Parerythrobacter jejuensis]MXP33534.1 Hsp33 family molecular chaperone HslO [Parerythrobacter jejuensis]